MNEKGIMPTCKSCKKEYDPIDLIRNSQVYDKSTKTIKTHTPCCSSGETIRIYYKMLERGYIYAAGGPHFSTMEEYDVDNLSYEETSDGLVVEFNEEKKTIKTNEPANKSL